MVMGAKSLAAQVGADNTLPASVCNIYFFFSNHVGWLSCVEETEGFDRAFFGNLVILGVKPLYTS